MYLFQHFSLLIALCLLSKGYSTLASYAKLLKKKKLKKKAELLKKKKSYLFSLSFNKLHFLHTSRLFLPITTVILFLFLSVNCIALLALSTWSSRNRWRKRRKEGILQQKIWNLCSLEMYSLVFYSCEFVEKEKENQVNFKKS